MPKRTWCNFTKKNNRADSNYDFPCAASTLDRFQLNNKFQKVRLNASFQHPIQLEILL